MDKKLTIALCLIKHNNEVLLLKRKKQPYKGYWSLVGGKVEQGETIKEAMLREVKEETGIEENDCMLHAVLHERMQTDKKTNLALVIFFGSLEAKNKECTESEEGSLQWFTKENIPDHMIPSDKYMAKHLQKETVKLYEVSQEEKDGVLGKCKIN